MSERTDRMIESYIKREEWLKARTLINRELRRDKNSHWLITRLAATYYEMRKYEKALELSQKALRLAPHCPLVLWDYAGALKAVGHGAKAVRIWQGLLARGVEAIAHDECGEGIRWAKSLMNDCRYRIGLAHADAGRFDAAVTYLKEHLANRSPGIPSVYPLSLVKRQLRGIERRDWCR